MSDLMTFPETWEEFEKSYGFTDSEEVYTNGSRLIPSFRVKQWLDHEESKRETKQQATVSSDCISREDAIAIVAFEIWHYPNELYTSLNCFENCQELAKRALNRLPSAESEPMCINLNEPIKVKLTDWGKPIGDGRPLADSEVIPRLQDIKRQIGGSYAIERAIEVLEELPSASTEFSTFSDKLWKIAYERGKAEGRKKGKWIEIKYTFHHKCSNCKWINNADSGYNFCPNCGSYNGGEEE